MIVQLHSNTTAARTQTELAAEELATKIMAAEAAIDAALAAVATLTAAMPGAGQRAALATHVLQPALMHGMETCAQLVKARTNIVRTHAALSTVRDDLGLTPVGLMDICGAPRGEQVSPLAAVAA